MFCNECGKEIKENAAVCVHCGVAVKGGSGGVSGEEKNWLVTLLLCIFLGGIGIHRFYSGHIGIGVIQLLTLGGCGIWTLIDLIMILTGSYTDSDGNSLAK